MHKAYLITGDKILNISFDCLPTMELDVIEMNGIQTINNSWKPFHFKANSNISIIEKEFVIIQIIKNTATSFKLYKAKIINNIIEFEKCELIN